MPKVVRGDHLGAAQRWRVVRALGAGQFAEVFEVEDTLGSGQGKSHVRYALKLERSPETNSVLGEYKVLRRLRELPFVPRAVELGEHAGRYFLVMDLLGRNLHTVRSSFPRGKLDIRRVREIGLATLKALHCVHQGGYVHRDVKPANFVYAHNDTNTWFLVDFGLARRFLDDQGELVAERLGAGFRGSSTYASYHAQQEKDQGRRDDLWSWLYTLVELITGTLPWRMLKVGCPRKSFMSEMLRMKLMCKNSPKELTAPLPMPWGLVKICEHLSKLEFMDNPDYELIKRGLQMLEDPQGVRGDDQTLFRSRMLPDSRSQGTGSDGQTRVSNSPTECSDRNEGCGVPGGASVERENELEGACLVSNNTPTPTSVRTRPMGYNGGNLETPDMVRLRSGSYCGSSQSVRTGGWDGRMHGNGYGSYQRRQGDGNYNGWNHQDRFPGHQGWNGEPYCRQECFRGPGPWRNYQWQGGGGVCWDHTGAGAQGKYPNVTYQNCSYQGYNCGPMSPTWNQEHHGHRDFDKTYGHGHLAHDNAGGTWRGWSSGARQVWACPENSGPHNGPGCEGLTEERPPGNMEMVSPRSRETIEAPTGGLVLKRLDTWKVEDANNVGGEGGARVLGKTNAVLGLKDSVVGKSAVVSLPSSSTEVGRTEDCGEADAKSNKRKRSNEMVEEGNRAGIKFMQDCVRWIGSEEGPSRGASLLKEFAAMDPLEGVSYVAAICSMLGSGSPNPLVKSVLLDISAYAKHLSQCPEEHSDKGSE